MALDRKGTPAHQEEPEYSSACVNLYEALSRVSFNKNGEDNFIEMKCSMKVNKFY